MKRFTSFLLALVAAVSILGPQPATAETLTLQNLKNLTFGSNQLNALVKPRLVAFEAGLLAGAATLTNLAATTVGKGASLIGIYDVATKITATTVEGALAEIAADNWVTSARIAAGAVAFGDMSLNSCTAGQVPAINGGGTAWECSTPTTGAVMVGDTGTGGTAGLVPAPAAGSRAAERPVRCRLAC